jgi:hypothetical protein
VGIIPHDLHLKHIVQEVTRAGPVRHGDRQMIKADVAPGSGFRADRLDGRDQ